MNNLISRVGFLVNDLISKGDFLMNDLISRFSLLAEASILMMYGLCHPVFQLKVMQKLSCII